MAAVYNLIIVDDELSIREGIRSLVDWEKLGFHVADTFSDGGQCIQWLSQNHADLVVTDLRMGSVSGLDVARYVSDHARGTRVVIISGHSDFEAAQAAMELRVESFLLKPISIRKIKQVFAQIKQTLDAERRDAEADGAGGDDAYREQAFAEDLLSGMLAKEKNLARYIRHFGWEAIADRPVTLFGLRVENYDAALLEFEDESELIAFLLKHLRQKGPYLFIKGTGETLHFVALDTPAGDRRAHIQDALGGIRSLVDLRIALLERHDYPNMAAMAAGLPESFLLPAQGVTLSRLRERQSMVMTCVLRTDLEQAGEYYAAFLRELKGSAAFLRCASVDFFAGLVEHLRGRNQSGGDTGIFPYYALLAAHGEEELLAAGAEAIQELSRMAMHLRAYDKETLIALACAYIDENYMHSVSLEQAAAHVFLSPVYFSRLFKEVKDETFIHYLIGRRLEKACRLLREGGDTVAEICAAVGYQNVKYFYHLFARRMGCTPTEYREARHENR